MMRRTIKFGMQSIRDMAKNENQTHSPISNKVYNLLFVVLFGSVIALSFSLYRLDQKLTELKDSHLNHPKGDVTPTQNIEPELKEDPNGRKDMRKLFAWKKNVREELTKMNPEMESIRKGNSKIKDEVKKLDSNVVSIKDKLHRMDNPNRMAINVKSTPNDLQRSVADLKKEVNANKDAIKQKSELIAALQVESKKSFEKIKDINVFIDQLNMRIQFEIMKKEIQLDFRKILELTGTKDRVSETHPTLKKLLDQKTSFEKLNKKWGIRYGDILRLICAEDFKEKKLPVLGKIGKMYDLFINTYKMKWKIEFKDVIKVTEKSDVRDTDVAGDKNHFDSVPKVFLKIDHLYKVFTATYKSKWHISFKDVFSVTEKLDFEVGATDIPVLKKIDSWFVDNFNEMWGDTFSELLHLLVRFTENRQNIIVARLKKVSKNNSLRFLPAKFRKTDKDITISGFVKVRIHESWGTIYKIQHYILNLVRVVCHQGGYADGQYLNDYPQEGSYDRTNMTRLLRHADCYGVERDITRCVNVKLERGTINWDPNDDLAVQCKLSYML